MALLLVTAAFVVTLWIVLLTVRRLRPRKFRIRATLTKWASLDLEMESPEAVCPVMATVQATQLATDVEAGRVPEIRPRVQSPCNTVRTTDRGRTMPHDLRAR